MNGDALGWRVVPPNRVDEGVDRDGRNRRVIELRDNAELSAVRRSVARAAWRLLGEARAGDVELCVSELVTNAIEHGEGRKVVVDHRTEPGVFVVSVSNGAQHPFSVSSDEIPPDSRTGLGLHVVRLVADEFSVSNDQGAVVVSCRFRY